MRYRWVQRSVGAVVGVIVAWGVLAYRSGAWLPSQTSVIAPGQFTNDGFSDQKKVAHLSVGDVAYLDEGQGPVIVLLHGCPFSAFEWQAVLPLLRRDHRVIVPDLFGLGDTPVTLNDDYRLPRDAQMVAELMTSLGISAADIVAHDHGGAVLQLLMQHAPQLINRAVMSNVEAYDAWPSAPELPYLKAIVSPLLSPLMFHLLQFEAVQREVFSIAVHDEATLTADVLRGWVSPHVASPARWQRLRRFFAWQLDPEHQKVTTGAVEAMRRFDRPVLLVWGVRDSNFGLPLAQRLARDIPGVRGIEQLERSAHMPMVEEPGAYANAVLEFLDHGRVEDAAQANADHARTAGASR